MRRTLTVAVFCSVGVVLAAAGQRPAAPAPGAARAASATPPTSMLTVDSIMRGPKLVGNAPTNIRWSKDSSKIYFSWQKAADDRAETYVVNRDGSGLAPFTGTPDVAVTGRFDRAHRRVVLVDSGDIAIVDDHGDLRAFDEIVKFLRGLNHDEQQVEFRRLGKGLQCCGRPLLALSDDNGQVFPSEQFEQFVFLKVFHAKRRIKSAIA